MTETDIQRAILEYLKVRRILHWRNQSNPVRGRVFTGRKGVPDICCIHNGRFIGIEVKTEKGKQSKEQKQFQADCEKEGGLYVLARSVEDVEKAIKAVIDDHKEG